jgi:general secretion pathway protein B
VQQAPQPTPVAAPILAPTPTPASAPVPAVEPLLQQPSAHEAATTASKPRQPANIAQPKVVTTLATPSPAPQSPLYSAHDLPDNIRANLPKLVISGASYSENPAHRMLIANGQIYREAEEVAPGLQIERINAKDAIFTFQGYRYTQTYP